MAVAIVTYLVIGLFVGMLVRLARSETTSLAGMAGVGGAGGVIGGVVANLLFSDEIELDLYGWVGAAILAIIAVLVIRTRPATSTTTTETTTTE
jgi:hypothetical protein